MAESVRAYGRSTVDPGDEVGHGGADLALVDPASASAQEERPLPIVPGQHGARLAQVLLEPLSCRNAVRNHAFAITLTAHPNEPTAVVHRVEVEPYELADADPRGVEDLDDGSVAHRDRPLRRRVVALAGSGDHHPFGGDVEQTRGLALGEDGRQRPT